MSSVSPKKSFNGWKLWEFLKGRKKMIVTLLGSLLGYFIASQELIGLLLGPVFEGVWAVVEYFLKEVKNE